jgi:hypothetical protein
VLLFGRSQLLLQFSDAFIRGALLCAQELRRAFGLNLATATVLLDEHPRQSVGDPLCALGRVIEIDDVEGIELRFPLGAGNRRWHFDLDSIEEPLDHLIERVISDQALLARDALEDDRAAELLRQCAQSFFTIEVRAPDQVRGDGRRLDSDPCARSIRRGQQKRQRHAREHAERERDREPHPSSREHAEILDGVYGSFSHLNRPLQICCKNDSDRSAICKTCLRNDDHVARFDAHRFSF